MGLFNSWRNPAVTLVHVSLHSKTKVKAVPGRWLTPLTPPPLQVKFDDNNPFSEGFQERERRERLREQQERQRVQLMQEVKHHGGGGAERAGSGLSQQSSSS